MFAETHGHMQTHARVWIARHAERVDELVEPDHAQLEATGGSERRERKRKGARGERERKREREREQKMDRKRGMEEGGERKTDTQTDKQTDRQTDKRDSPPTATNKLDAGVDLQWHQKKRREKDTNTLADLIFYSFNHTEAHTHTQAHSSTHTSTLKHTWKWMPL